MRECVLWYYLRLFKTVVQHYTCLQVELKETVREKWITIQNFLGVLCFNFHEIFSGVFHDVFVLGECYRCDISYSTLGRCILTALFKHHSTFFCIGETKLLIELKPTVKLGGWHVGSFIFLYFFHSHGYISMDLAGVSKKGARHLLM